MSTMDSVGVIDLSNVEHALHVVSLLDQLPPYGSVTKSVFPLGKGLTYKDFFETISEDEVIQCEIALKLFLFIFQNESNLKFVDFNVTFECINELIDSCKTEISHGMSFAVLHDGKGDEEVNFENTSSEKSIGKISRMKRSHIDDSSHHSDVEENNHEDTEIFVVEADNNVNDPVIWGSHGEWVNRSVAEDMDILDYSYLAYCVKRFVAPFNYVTHDYYVDKLSDFNSREILILLVSFSAPPMFIAPSEYVENYWAGIIELNDGIVNDSSLYSFTHSLHTYNNFPKVSSYRLIFREKGHMLDSKETIFTTYGLYLIAMSVRYNPKSAKDVLYAIINLLIEESPGFKQIFEARSSYHDNFYSSITSNIVLSEDYLQGLGEAFMSYSSDVPPGMVNLMYNENLREENGGIMPGALLVDSPESFQEFVRN